MINKDYLVFFGLQSVRELVKNALVVYNVEIPVEREDYRVRLEKNGEIGLVCISLEKSQFLSAFMSII